MKLIKLSVKSKILRIQMNKKKIIQLLKDASSLRRYLGCFHNNITFEGVLFCSRTPHKNFHCFQESMQKDSCSN